MVVKSRYRRHHAGKLSIFHIYGQMPIPTKEGHLGPGESGQLS